MQRTSDAGSQVCPFQGLYRIRSIAIPQYNTDKNYGEKTYHLDGTTHKQFLDKLAFWNDTDTYMPRTQFFSVSSCGGNSSMIFATVKKKGVNIYSLKQNLQLVTNGKFSFFLFFLIQKWWYFISIMPRWNRKCTIRKKSVCFLGVTANWTDWSMTNKNA